MPVPVPATLDEFKLHLNKAAVQPPPEDAELQLHLESATEAVEGWAAEGRAPVGPLITRQFTERVAVDFIGRFRIERNPLVSLVRAVLARDPAVVVDPFAPVDFDPLTGIIHRSSLAVGDWNVDYTAGRGATGDDIPRSLKLAVLIVGAHIWETQRGPRTRTFYGQAATDEATGHKTGIGYLIPNRAAHLMKPFCGVLIA